MPAKTTMGGTGVRCLNCGEEQAIPYPVKISIMTAICKAFDKDHRSCKLTERGKSKFAYSTPYEWFHSWDTGISAMTIYHVIMGSSWGSTFRPGVPHDPDDFGRCYRLLAVAPGWAERLPEVAEKYPEWKPLVDNWAELTALYEEELTSGKAPKLYERMRELGV